MTDDPQNRWDGDGLLRWLENRVDSGRLSILLGVLSSLAIINIALFLAWLLTPIGAWFLVTFVLYASIYIGGIKHSAHLFAEAEHLYGEINRFRPVMLYLERYSFHASPLRALCTPFQSDPRPTKLLKRIGMLAAAAGTQKSELLRVVLNTLAPWDLAFAWLLARYKTRVRSVLPEWMDAWRTLEAAASLATFGALNPTATFAEHRADGGQSMNATGLGHPLIPESEKVRNDFAFDGRGQIALITGSNMSGKSTFLRTVGINLVLAQAGSPVDAVRFAASPMRVFTCINVTDSVNDGISYFYAEVKRLKALLDELRRDYPLPVCFLVDEIFRGTNNRERLAGSRAFLRSLAAGSGSGLVSTHDLELVTLEEEIDGLSNYHFRESIFDGRMVFDYRLRPGPCPTTNALRIMALEGLPVEKPGA